MAQASFRCPHWASSSVFNDITHFWVSLQDYVCASIGAWSRLYRFDSSSAVHGAKFTYTTGPAQKTHTHTHIASTATCKMQIPTRERRQLVRRVTTVVIVCRWSVFSRSFSHHPLNSIVFGAPYHRAMLVVVERAHNNTSVWNVAKSRRCFIFRAGTYRCRIPLSVPLSTRLFTFVRVVYRLRVRTSTATIYWIQYFNCANRISE